MDGNGEPLEEDIRPAAEVAELIDKGGPDDEVQIPVKRGRAISPEKGGPDQDAKHANKAREVMTK